MLRRRYRGSRRRTRTRTRTTSKEADKSEAAQRPVNEAITAPAIVLIDGAGKRIGLVVHASRSQARRATRSAGHRHAVAASHQLRPSAAWSTTATGSHMERAQARCRLRAASAGAAKTVQLRQAHRPPRSWPVKCAAMRRFLQKRTSRCACSTLRRSAAEGDWVELFGQSGRAELQGVGSVSGHDVCEARLAVFEPVRKGKKEGEEGRRARKSGKEPKVQVQQIGAAAIAACS